MFGEPCSVIVTDDRSMHYIVDLLKIGEGETEINIDDEQ